MTPDPDNALFWMLRAAYARRTNSVPIESTYERTTLENLEFDIACEAETAHQHGVYGHAGPATHMCTTPCNNNVMLCAGSVEHMQTVNARTYCVCGDSHANREYTFTPLPEGNR